MHSRSRAHVPLKYRLAKAYASVWRFRTLQFAKAVFHGVTTPSVLPSRFCGFEIFVDVTRSDGQRLVFLEGERFVPERHIIARLVRPGMCVVDVGANIGYYMLMFARLVGSEGRVMCFEPEPNNVKELRRNVWGNSLQNVEVFEAAAGMGIGRVGFWEGINGRVREDSSGTFTVALTTLDTAISGRVDLLKVDVEGYEAEVLFGAERLLREYRPSLFIEIHPWLLRGYTVADIVSFLRRWYPSLSFYERSPEQTLLEKVRSRYAGNAIRRMGYEGELRELGESGRRQRTFWVVATQSR